MILTGMHTILYLFQTLEEHIETLKDIQKTKEEMILVKLTQEIFL